MIANCRSVAITFPVVDDHACSNETSEFAMGGSESRSAIRRLSEIKRLDTTNGPVSLR